MSRREIKHRIPSPYNGKVVIHLLFNSLDEAQIEFRVSLELLYLLRSKVFIIVHFNLGEHTARLGKGKTLQAWRNDPSRLAYEVEQLLRV